MGLITGTELHAGRRAVLFAALAYVPTLLLALLQGYALGEQHQRALLFDFGAYATVVAIAAFVLMEQSSDWRMRVMMHKFVAQDLLTPAERPRIEQARQAMERRTGAWWAEAVLLVAAYVLAYRWQFGVAQRIDGGTWVGRVVDGDLQLTLAGMWALAVMMPLFLFLLGRWLWRFFTWGWLLRDIARCELRLVATHADRCGGLAFIGQYPKTYMLFVFALSTIVSAAVAKQVIYGGASLLSFKFAAIGMVVFLVVSFVMPLFAFTPLLTRLKFDGLTMYSGLISRHNLAFEAKWLTGASAAARRGGGLARHVLAGRPVAQLRPGQAHPAGAHRQGRHRAADRRGRAADAGGGRHAGADQAAGGVAEGAAADLASARTPPYRRLAHPRHAPRHRILRVGVARRRGMAGRHQRGEEGFVLGA